MTLVVARFDLDEAVLASNTIRPTPPWSTLPNRFPFLIDDDTGAVVEPVLVYLANKFTGPNSFKGGEWIHQASADAAAADLKDWWAKLAATGTDWDEADPELLDSYLMDLRNELSERTDDFLTLATQARRQSSINEFHRFARSHWDLLDLPTAIRTRSLVGWLSAMESTGDAAATSVLIGRRHDKSDRDPHPFSSGDLSRICVQLGPLPREVDAAAFERRSGVVTSGPRLAMELAVEAGLRVSEIVNLRSATIDGLRIADDDDDYDAKVIELRKTKGLVRRKAYIWVWLVRELKTYIRGEREIAVRIASERGRGQPPAQLACRGQ